MIEYDEIGRIADQSGEYDEDGVETKPPTFLSGWFINATELDPVIAEFQISPSNPVRVFSDAPTVYLRFEDEAQWVGIREGLIEA